MKMSEVFKLPLEYAGACYQDQQGYCFGGNDIRKDSAAVHAINCHDDMLEALEYCLDCLGDEFALPIDCIDQARAAIAKARGESE